MLAIMQCHELLKSSNIALLQYSVFKVFSKKLNSYGIYIFEDITKPACCWCNPLMHRAGSFETYGVGYLLLGVVLHSQTENFAVLLGKPFCKSVNLSLREHLTLEIWSRIGDVHNVAAVLDKLV